MERFLGIDVSADTLDYHLIDREGATLAAGSVANTKVGIGQLARQLNAPDSTCAVFESTGVYGKRLCAYLPGKVGRSTPS